MKEKEEGKCQVAERERERERERESPIWGKMFLQLCGGFGGVAHQQNFWLFNFSTAVVQVSHRYSRMKIRIFSLLFVEVIVKIPMYLF